MRELRLEGPSHTYYNWPNMQITYDTKSVVQLSQRDRAAGWVSYGQKWKTVNGRQYFTDIIGLPSTTMT